MADDHLFIRYFLIPLVLVLVQYIIMFIYIDHQFRKYGLSIKDLPAVLEQLAKEREAEQKIEEGKAPEVDELEDIEEGE